MKVESLKDQIKSQAMGARLMDGPSGGLSVKEGDRRQLGLKRGVDLFMRTEL